MLLERLLVPSKIYLSVSLRCSIFTIQMKIRRFVSVKISKKMYLLVATYHHFSWK